MTARIVTGFVSLGVLLAVAAGASGGFDLFAAVVLIFIALIGALAVAMAHRSATGRVMPATCPACAGVISPNAPYCKRCGARQ